MNSNGTNQKRIIASPALDALPDWSPDSKQIAFASERSGKTNRKIYIANANGSNVHLLVRRGSARPAGDAAVMGGAPRG